MRDFLLDLAKQRRKRAKMSYQEEERYNRAYTKYWASRYGKSKPKWTEVYWSKPAYKFELDAARGYYHWMGFGTKIKSQKDKKGKIKRYKLELYDGLARSFRRKPRKRIPEWAPKNPPPFYAHKKEGKR